MKDVNWIITQWCKTITSDGENWYVNAEKMKDSMIYDFRLLDGDDVVYAYGVSDDCDSEKAFEPLDYYKNHYGLVSIQYKDKTTGNYEYL